MEKIDRIIEIIREQMVANAPGSQGGFGSSSPSKGPTSGYDKITYAKGGRGSRKKWLDYLRSQSNGRRN
jgi:hypothetical protein